MHIIIILFFIILEYPTYLNLSSINTIIIFCTPLVLSSDVVLWNLLIGIVIILI